MERHSNRTPRSTDPLGAYNAKRDFGHTPEPRGEVASPVDRGLAFVIQKHAATALHYDVRLELDGVMLSWAVPKGPSLDPADKRLAMRTEDHPVSYNTFEGTIPEGHYGAGNVIVWDRGHWAPVGDAHRGLADGKLEFSIQSKKLAGRWELIRTNRPGDKRERWLFFKKRDSHARPRAEYDVTTARPESVNSGRNLAPRGKPMDGEPEGSEDCASKPKDSALAKSSRARRLPTKLSPQLATLAAAAPSSGDWVFEAKLDGYRVLARIEADSVRLLTRTGKDWSAKMPHLLAEIRALGIGPTWFDGEVVVLVEGVPKFNDLQNAFDTDRTRELIYFVFDSPFLDGEDLRHIPLSKRRERLDVLLASRQTDHLRLNVALDGTPEALLAKACSVGLEGIVAKRAQAPYVSARSTDWLKLKCQRRQEFVVGGYTLRSGGRATAADEVGSLLLGYHDGDGLRYAGSVGTGWDSQTAQRLKTTLDRIAAARSPFVSTPARGQRRVLDRRWVHPRLVVEVEFSEWTPDGQLRHPSFQGVRLDKDAKSVRREHASAASSGHVIRSSKRRARS